MSVEVALATAVALITVLVIALLRAVAELRTRVDVLERALARGRKRDQARFAGRVTVLSGSARSPLRDAASFLESGSLMTSEPSSGRSGHMTSDVAGDAVDVTGVTPQGDAVTIELERPAQPTLLAFLSTSCGICTTLWARLREEGLQTVRPVVVTKDADKEDLDLVRALSDGDLAVVLSGEAWDDYEVPGSPYFMLIGGDAGNVLAEGTASRWEDVLSLSAKA